MSRQDFRNPAGGLIDRDHPMRFSFDGRDYTGYAGDTLASALLANGVRLLGRSFKYHRPRGIFGSGAEEPNALIRLREGERAEPNLRATQVELYDGLVASSQNRWPTLEFDIGASTTLLSRFLPAGFYYKTFMWPASAWMFYERFIRRAAGLGRSATQPDPDHYDKRHLHCDVLVVGGGPTGLAAALAAGRSGARVILVDEHARLGGSLLGERAQLDGAPALDWVETTLAALERAGVVVLRRATAFGYYDHNLVAVTERLADHQPVPPPFQARQRLSLIRARQVVLATGAIERPLVFAGNDCPGVMLASAARTYANQYAVRCGSKAVLFTNNDSAYATAYDLHTVGVIVVAVVDARQDGPGPGHRERLDGLGIEYLGGHAVVQARGTKALRGVDVMALGANGEPGGTSRALDCDLLCVSGGWNPTVHLFSQSQGKLRFADDIAAFVPDESRQAERSAGAARGVFGLGVCLAEGLEAGHEAARLAGFEGGAPLSLPTCETIAEAPLQPLWAVPPAPGRHGKRFVDLQNDVTAEDIGLAAREGYVSVEHLKRYTTLGMGTDQGRTSNVNGLAILAGILDTAIPGVGTTTFRPPYTPVTLGALAGHEVGAHFTPTRYSPMHHWHVEAGARFVTAGLWLRAQCYPRAGESLTEAIHRETVAVRRGVGLVDVSTLGKIEIRGRDAGVFLERVYINRWQSLKVGRCRYGLMLREDGLLLDDGTTTRIGENHYYMTTTTANAARIMAHLEYYAQTVWPELHVHLTSVTDQWAALAIAGPDSRAVLAAAVDGADISNEALPFLAYRETTIQGAPVRLFRITFSGELAYEVHTPADYGTDVWEALLEAGRSRDIVPYGTEAMGILRIEKGHVVIGAELDGRTTPADLGFGRMQRPAGGFIGDRSQQRPALQEAGRKQLVGLFSADGATLIPRSAQLLDHPAHELPAPMLGHVTSATYSPNLQRPIALALLENGADRHGETLYALSPLTRQAVRVTVANPVFIDPEGERPRG